MKIGKQLRLSGLRACFFLLVSFCTNHALADGPWTASSGFNLNGTQGPTWFYQERPHGGGTAANLSWNTGGSNVWWTADQTGWIGSYQGVADAHPGQNSDTIRKWVSPITGTVAITGRVYKMNLAGGAGVVASVEQYHTLTQTTQVLWSKTVAYNDAIGYTTDADLGAVAVEAGDSISFVMNDNSTYGSDQTAWDPTIIQVAAYVADAGYADGQGQNGQNQWSYQERPKGGGSITNLNWTAGPGYTDPVHGSTSFWQTTDSPGPQNSLGWVYWSSFHPSPSFDVMRVWTAPFSGTISIRGRVYKGDIGGAGQGIGGVNVSVEQYHVQTQTTQVLWSRSLAPGDNVGYSTDSALSCVPVNAGDTIAFVGDVAGTYGFDQTNWNPTIALIASSSPLGR